MFSRGSDNYSSVLYPRTPLHVPAVLPAAVYLNHTPGDCGNADVEPGHRIYIYVCVPYFSSFGLQQPTELVWTQLWPPGWLVTVWNRRATDSLGLWTPAGFATGSGTAGQAVPVPGPDTACSCSTEETATFQLEEMDLKKTTQTIPTLCYFCILKSEALLRYFKLNPQWPLYVKASICIPKKIASFFFAEQLKAIFMLLSFPLKRITFSTTDSLLCVAIMVSD